MKKIFLSFALLITMASSFAQIRDHQNANQISIIINNPQEKYEFLSEQFWSNFDRESAKFEFYLPLESIYTTDSLLGSQLIREIFQPGANSRMKLEFNIEEQSVKNLRSLNNTEHFRLDGILTINEDRFEVPLQLWLYSSGNALFYSLQFSLNIERITPLVSAEYQHLMDEELDFVVDDGKWNDFFTNYY